MLAVATLPTRPPTLAARFANAKKRPRRVTGITRPITSIHAGMSTPPTPVTIRSIRSITASAAAGARSAPSAATLWRSSRLTRSAETDVEPAVCGDDDPLALAHQHRGRGRLEDRRALDLLPGRQRVHPVHRDLDPVAEPDTTARGRPRRPALGRAGARREHRERADHGDARVDDDDLLARRAVGVELFVPAVETLGHLIEQVTRPEVHAVEVHLDLQDLLAVPHVEPPADADRPVQPGHAP